MTDDRPESTAPEASGASAEPASADSAPVEPGSERRHSRGRSWQFPLIAMSLLAILAAFWHRSNIQAAEFDPSPRLRFAASLLERGDAEGASAILAELDPDDEAFEPHRSEYRLLLADCLAERHAPLESAGPDVASRIADAYLAAVSADATLSELQRRHLAVSEANAGRHADAVTRFGGLLDARDQGIATDARARRHGLMQRALLEDLEAGVEPVELANSVNALLDEDPGLGIESWAVGFRARLRIREGDLAGLIPAMIVDMQRLEGASERSPGVVVDWAELHVLLGHAYLAAGRPVPAAERYEFVIDRLGATSTVVAEAMVALGRLHLARGEFDAAKLRFAGVASVPQVTARQRLAARIGLGELAAIVGDPDAAMREFDDAAVIIRGNPSFPASALAEPVLAAVRSSDRMMRHARVVVDRASEAEVVSVARDLARFAVRFGGDPTTRMQALATVADTHRRAVELAVGPAFDGVDLREVPYEAIPVAARIEANRHLVAAAEAVLEIDLLTPSKTYRSDLLWQAAELYDTAGRPRKALALYERFVDGEADHQNRPEAMYRIALGLHGMMRFDEAAVWYRRLLEEGEANPDEKSGYWTRAKVGLARALLVSPGSGGSLEAERLLRDFLEGREVDPRSVDYRDATFHLGRLLIGQERWLEAVESLEPWLDRYPDDDRWGEASALAGVGWLNRAEMLATQLDDDSTEDLEHSPISPGYRAELEIARRSSLVQALDRFEGVVARLDGVDPPLLSPLQRHLLRVAGLQRGTVRERLGESDAAIAVYREVEQRFAEEPVAVEALVSLANLASRIGDEAMANKATRRARIKLQRIEQRRRTGASVEDGIEGHGPDLFVGGGSASLDRWLRLFPPGGGGGAG